MKDRRYAIIGRPPPDSRVWRGVAQTPETAREVVGGIVVEWVGDAPIDLPVGAIVSTHADLTRDRSWEPQPALEEPL